MRIWIPQFIVNAIIRKAQKTPYTHLPGYMNRWWLARFGGANGSGESGSYTRYAARVHEILRSDEGRDFHNHPWPFVTIILRGGYWERRPVFGYEGELTAKETRKWYGPGSIIFRRPDDFHMVDLPEGKTSWSLFIMGPFKHEWGFLVDSPSDDPFDIKPAEVVNWRDYKNRNSAEQQEDTTHGDDNASQT